MRFTVRRPPTGEVSPCCHRPSGGDVVQSALLRNTHTGLLGSSARSAGHRPHVKGLDPDRVETARDVSCDLFDPVLSPVGLTRFQLRDRLFRSCAPVGTPLAAREPLLQHLQPLGLTPGKTRDMQQLTGGQRRRYGRAAVDADHTAVVRTGDRVGDVDEGDMPAPGPIAGDPVRLDTIGHRPRQAKSHPSHLGHPYPTDAAVQPLNVMWFYRDLPKPFVHAGLAPRRASAPLRMGYLHGLKSRISSRRSDHE